MRSATNNFGFHLQIDATQKLVGRLKGVDAKNQLQSAAKVGAGVWSTVVQRTSASAHTIAYNGAEVASQPTPAPVPTPTDAMLIGAALKSGPALLEGSFSGAIDEVRLMDRALHPDELLHYPRLAPVGLSGVSMASCDDANSCTDDGFAPNGGQDLQ